VKESRPGIAHADGDADADGQIPDLPVGVRVGVAVGDT
jgi:hypothetical protein